MSFTFILTGVYSYPVNQAAEIVVRTVMDFVAVHREAMDEIVWVLFDDWTKDAYDRALEKAEKEQQTESAVGEVDFDMDRAISESVSIPDAVSKKKTW